MSALTIGLDFRPALSRATGVGRYFQGLVSGLSRIDEENTYVLFTSSWKERPNGGPRPDNFVMVDRRVPVRLLNFCWNRLGAPSLDWLTGHHYDVAHSTTPLLLPSRGARSVVTICDLFFLRRPETTGREIRRDYVSLVRSHALQADQILAISETTAEDVVHSLDVPRDRITVIHAGVDERFLARSQVPADEPDVEPYLLAVATEEPRKNIPTLLEALSRLKRRSFEGRLLIAGARGRDTPRIEESIARLGLERAVERLGYVDSNVLPALYRRARLVVLPSLWEGFGLPLLEAMASETAVVASDIPVHREVAGERGALFVPAEEPEAIAAGLEWAWEDDAARSRLVDEGRLRVTSFTWEASARKALALYRRLGGESR